MNGDNLTGTSKLVTIEEAAFKGTGQLKVLRYAPWGQGVGSASPGLKSIGKSAFEGSGITYFELREQIPANTATVIGVGEDAFKGWAATQVICVFSRRMSQADKDWGAKYTDGTLPIDETKAHNAVDSATPKTWSNTVTEGWRNGVAGDIIFE